MIKIASIVVLLAIALAGPPKAAAQAWAQTSATTNAWSGITCSADGSKLFAAAGYSPAFSARPSPIFSSTNGGLTWLPISGLTNYWAGIAASADGTKLVAFTIYTLGGARIYDSTNAGINWTSNQFAFQSFNSVASSADGSKLYAASQSGVLYTSLNSGGTWVTNSALSGVSYATCSPDGSRVAAIHGGSICVSTNFGASWTTNNLMPYTTLNYVASSANGQVLAAAEGGGGPNGHIYTSTNYGATWATNNVPLLWWQFIALSADGSKIVASAIYGSGNTVGPIYTSTNTGLTWTSNTIPNALWQGVACSADGNLMVGVSGKTNRLGSGTGAIWTSQTVPSPALNMTVKNGLKFAWLIPSTNFILQQSSDLAAWSAVTNVPVLNLTNLQNEVTLPFAGSASFYRLNSP